MCEGHMAVCDCSDRESKSEVLTDRVVFPAEGVGRVASIIGLAWNAFGALNRHLAEPALKRAMPPRLNRMKSREHQDSRTGSHAAGRASGQTVDCSYGGAVRALRESLLAAAAYCSSA